MAPKRFPSSFGNYLSKQGPSHLRIQIIIILIDQVSHSTLPFMLSMLLAETICIPCLGASIAFTTVVPLASTVALPAWLDLSPNVFSLRNFPAWKGG